MIQKSYSWEYTWWNHNLKRYMHLYVHSSTVHNSQNTEATYMPTDEWMGIDRWMDEEGVVYMCICAYTHTHNGILLSHRKEQNNAICSNMIKRDYHTKWSKSERERQICNLYVEFKIWHKWTYLNRNRDQICGCQGVGWGMDWEFGVDRCKLLHLEWINSKVLLYGTGNNIQSPGINHIGKEYQKRGLPWWLRN